MIKFTALATALIALATIAHAVSEEKETLIDTTTLTDDSGHVVLPDNAEWSERGFCDVTYGRTRVGKYDAHYGQRWCKVQTCYDRVCWFGGQVCINYTVTTNVQCLWCKANGDPNSDPGGCWQ